ncbi:galanin-like peptide isoform X1 [Panthera leo]|uniref:galanin-like peptide isoform X1 n=1 Tax=Panthera leo TaxID=9689 RepID=UPI001C69C8C6|nr:galanin-like peptide isoform X1 [Panthera leo]
MAEEAGPSTVPATSWVPSSTFFRAGAAATGRRQPWRSWTCGRPLTGSPIPTLSRPPRRVRGRPWPNQRRQTRASSARKLPGRERSCSLRRLHTSPLHPSLQLLLSPPLAPSTETRILKLSPQIPCRKFGVLAEFPSKVPRLSRVSLIFPGHC